ncbi:hypothetical protein LTR09_008859 [Extremus antarcticus]|uniref:Asparaginase n=1 Tax=Extremus antarcticus TaxID=702011 RepID=A0AAJ0DGZ5_9PEZI|nr:hypothetical protein LTR09_008859 [Extremus antarcticus]
MDPEKSSKIKPRIIIHGGAGNITRKNLPSKAYAKYRHALLGILDEAYTKLRLPGATALDVAAHAVSLLENNGLFNSGHGAVFTTEETHELEASIMVSKGYRKRGVGIMNVTRAKNPIMVAREMLIKGEEDDGGGAQGHVQLQGPVVDRLAEEWGLEIVKPSYFWTRKRWDEHRRGMGREDDNGTYQRHRWRADHGHDKSDQVSRSDGGIENDLTIDDLGWDGEEYLPQGTVGAVVLDSSGTVCCATSTGGLTNKLPGRIGDTPSLGAGFFAEEWTSIHTMPAPCLNPSLSLPVRLPTSLSTLLADCLPSVSGFLPLRSPNSASGKPLRTIHKTRAVAMSGTGNGDSFLRLSAVRTAAAMARFKSGGSSDSSGGGDSSNMSASDFEHFPLQYAVTSVAGPNGMLQQSAEDRWHKTGEGEGGIIGIEFADGKGAVVYDYNCGGMFHAWIDDGGKARFQVFRDRVDV